MSEYSVEEIRAHAELLRNWESPQVCNDDAADMLTAYADLREQIERARADEVTGDAVKRALSTFNTARNYDGDAAGVAMRKVLTEFAAIEAALSAQPAQAAKVDMDGKAQWDELAAILGCDGDNVDLVFRTAKRIMSERLPTAEPVAQGEAVPSWVDALAEKWACCIAAEHFAGPTLRQCASELLDAAYGRKGPPYSFVYGLGRAQPASPEQPSGRQGEELPSGLFRWLAERQLVPDADEDGTFSMDDLITALNDHENALLTHPAAPVGVPYGMRRNQARLFNAWWDTSSDRSKTVRASLAWEAWNAAITQNQCSVPIRLEYPREGQVINYECERSYVDGWNGCRIAMLAAAPPYNSRTTGAIGENGK